MRQQVKNLFQLLGVCPSEPQPIEGIWTKYKNALLDSAAREVLGPYLYAKKPWITLATLSIIHMRRNAMQRGALEEYCRLGWASEIIEA